MINFEGVGAGRDYTNSYGYVYHAASYGSYFNLAGEEVHREMIRDHPANGSRESPVYRKKSRQLKYLAYNENYSVDPKYSRFRYLEIHFIDFHTGGNVLQVNLTTPLLPLSLIFLDRFGSITLRSLDNTRTILSHFG